jgi:hypothetical protein
VNVRVKRIRHSAACMPPVDTAAWAAADGLIRCLRRTGSILGRL